MIRRQSGKFISSSICLCECGTTKIIRTPSLRDGSTQSCGCLHYEALQRANIKHDHARVGLKNRTYESWIGMKKRCHSPNDQAYPDYGGRGIWVCERWRNSFENFLADMGERPLGMSIERRNNDAGYSPDNCYWATKKQQARNRRSSKMVTVHGVTGCLAFVCEHFGLNASTINARLLMGWGLDRAFDTPVKPSPLLGRKRDHR